MIIKNGNILLFEQSGFVKRDICVENGKIVKVAEHLDGECSIDAAGKYITPGLIDAHCHICISEEGMGDMGDDCNDCSGGINPYLETLDGIYPFDLAVKESVHAGVTTVCVCPGSDAVIGGVACVISLSGTVADRMLIKRKAAMKCALGENPKTSGHGYKSRMGTAYMIRKCLEDAKDYKHQKEQALARNEYFREDMGMENMLLVLDRKMPLHAHVHRSDDICTAIRIAQEYNIRLVLLHCTDGRAVKDYMAEFDYPVIAGPTFGTRSKLELMNKSFATAGELQKVGLKVCITSDHEINPLRYLKLYAAMAVDSGMDELEAFKAITKNPAEVLEINDRKGELKEGLDADIVIWNKHPFAFDAHVEQVFIEGVSQID